MERPCFRPAVEWRQLDLVSAACSFVEVLSEGHESTDEGGGPGIFGQTWRLAVAGGGV